MLTFLKRKYRNLTDDKGFSEILTGTAWAMLSRVGTTVLALISSLMITRLYGAEAMGILALVVSILSIVTVFTALGIDTSILRLIPEHIIKYSATSAFRLYRKTQYLVAGVSVITGVILLLLAPRIAGDIFDKPQLSGLVASSAGFVLFKSLMLLNQQAVRGIKLIKTYAFLQLLPSLVLVSLLLIGLRWRSPTVPAYAQLVAWALTGIVGAIVMDRAFRRKMHRSDITQSIHAKSILSLSLPMLMTDSMQIIMSQTGIIILGMYRPTYEVGYYSVAVRLATLTTFMLKSINTMSAPVFSELYNQDRIDELLRVTRKSSRLIVISTTPILLCLLLIGKIALRVFGTEFTAAYPAMLILLIGQFFNSAAGSTGHFMNMTGQQSRLRNIMMVATILNVLLCLLLVSRMGIMGIALATCVSTVFWNASAVFAIHSRFGQITAWIPLISQTIHKPSAE